MTDRTPDAREALEELVAVVEAAGAASVGIFLHAENHGIRYNGPTWEKELARAKAALAAPAQQPVALTEEQGCPNCDGLGYRREANGEALACDLCGDRLDAIRQCVEKAVMEHVAGGDLWLCTQLAAKEIAQRFAHPAAPSAAQPAQQAVAPGLLLQMVLDDMDVCFGECGAGYEFKELSAETVEALTSYRQKKGAQ
jgi:hypothetical protein